MAYQYNPLENGFTTFESVENPTVEIQLPTMPEPLNLSNNFLKIGEDGIPLALNKININFNSKHEDPILTQDYEELSPSKVNTNISGRKKQAMEFFQSKGLAPHQAAGIVGNLMGESNLNPTAVNPSSKAYGIAQWLGSRKKKLFSKYGNDPSFEQQLDFIWDELNGDERNAFDKLLLTLSAKEATNSFMKHFERPSQREMAQSIATRIKYSESLLSND